MNFLNKLWPLLWLNISANGILASPFIPTRLRPLLLESVGLRVRGTRIMHGVFFGGYDIAVGAGTFLSAGVKLDNGARIEIGRGCSLALGVTVITSSHEIGSASQRAGTPKNARVVIGDGAWIGAGAVILPGVTIGQGCVVGAGAVVTADCLPNGIYVGVPARFIRGITS